MSYQKRLDQAFENVPVLPLDDNHKYVVFSDCHRGSGNNCLLYTSPSPRDTR